jgi:hypothetical protein
MLSLLVFVLSKLNDFLLVLAKLPVNNLIIIDQSEPDKVFIDRAFGWFSNWLGFYSRRNLFSLVLPRVILVAVLMHKYIMLLA